MSEQKDERPTPSKRRASPAGRARRAPQPPKHQDAVHERPKPDDLEGWKAHWQAQGQPWRTEPEINEERQRFLTERRAIKEDHYADSRPFKDIELSRADVEWLLATHESAGILGPIDLSDESQLEREGLDLNFANLRNQDLSTLPLSKVSLVEACLDKAILVVTELYEANLGGAQLREANLWLGLLGGCSLEGAHLEEADLAEAILEGANLREANLKGANLSEAQLEGANLWRAQLKGTDLSEANLQGADLREASLDADTKLAEIVLDAKTLVADLVWNSAPLTQINWEQVPVLGDEEALKKGEERPFADFLAAIRANRQLATSLRSQGLNEEADRFAYHAQVLKRKSLWTDFRLGNTEQDELEDELHFWSIARMKQTITGWWWRMQKLGAYLLSLFLAALAGYGYKPGRSIIAYLLIILSFMGLYLLNAQFVAPHLTWDQALVLSVSSFHGRGFFEQDITLGSGYARLAAFEAVVGLLIEISFIATFTQRFFGK